MRRAYERVTCPCCSRVVSAYVPHRGDGSDVRLVKHNLVRGGRGRPVDCPASTALLREWKAKQAMMEGRR